MLFSTLLKKVLKIIKSYETVFKILPLIENVPHYRPVVHLLTHSLALMLCPLYDGIQKRKLRIKVQVSPTNDVLQCAQLDVAKSF